MSILGSAIFSNEIMQKGRLVLPSQLSPRKRHLGNNDCVYSQNTMSAKRTRGLLPMNNIAELARIVVHGYNSR